MQSVTEAARTGNMAAAISAQTPDENFDFNETFLQPLALANVTGSILAIVCESGSRKAAAKPVCAYLLENRSALRMLVQVYLNDLVTDDEIQEFLDKLEADLPEDDHPFLAPSSQRKGVSSGALIEDVGQQAIVDVTEAPMPTSSTPSTNQLAIQAEVMKKVTHAIFDSFVLTNGRAIGDMTMGDMRAYARQSGQEHRIALEIIDGYPNAPHEDLVRDVVKAKKLENWIRKAQEVKYVSVD